MAPHAVPKALLREGSLNVRVEHFIRKVMERNGQVAALGRAEGECPQAFLGLRPWPCHEEEGPCLQIRKLRPRRALVHSGLRSAKPRWTARELSCGGVMGWAGVSGWS